MLKSMGAACPYGLVSQARSPCSMLEQASRADGKLVDNCIVTALWLRG